MSDFAYLNTTLIGLLLGLVTWNAKRALGRLDAIVSHLADLNRRTSKLEGEVIVLEKFTPPRTHE